MPAPARRQIPICRDHYYLYFSDYHFNRVAVGFAELFSDRLQNADHIADIAVFIFNAHIDDTAVIRYPVKCRVDFYTPFSEFFSDIVRKNDVSPAAFGVNVYRRGKAICFSFFISNCLVKSRFAGMIVYAFSELLPHLTRIAARTNSAVPASPALLIFFLNRSSATYISPRPAKISSVQV